MKRYIRKLIRHWFYSLKERPIRNVFSESHEKRVLISYLSSPFRNRTKRHTNSLEVLLIAESFREEGYVVDVVYYGRKKPIKFLKDYDVVMGFGEPMQALYYSNESIPYSIYYATGNHVSFQNLQTINRLKDVQRKSGRVFVDSARYQPNVWLHQIHLADKIVCLGNSFCRSTYIENGCSLDSTKAVGGVFYEIFDIAEVVRLRTSESNKNFLWFGGAGAVHKGLDLLLEFFSSNDLGLKLHVCGSVENEVPFFNHYQKELLGNSNIKYYGFIDVESEVFFELLTKCDFVLSPSCSEGGSLGVLNVVANGGLIPIASKESGLDVVNSIGVEELTIKGVSNAVGKAVCWTHDDIMRMRLENVSDARNRFSTDNFKRHIKDLVKDIS